MEAGAGENCTTSCNGRWTRGWPGLENLSPDSRHGRCRTDPEHGAYGLEVGECLHSRYCPGFARQTSRRSFDRDDCRFGLPRQPFSSRSGWHLNGGIAITSVVSAWPRPGSPTAAMPTWPRNWRSATSPHRRRATSRRLSSPCASASCPTRQSPQRRQLLPQPGSQRAAGFEGRPPDPYPATRSRMAGSNWRPAG